MGRDKRRILLGARTLLETALASLLDGGCFAAVVVLEPGSPCRDLPGLRRAILAVNPDPARGMLSSFREGLARLPPEADAVAVLPGDHPFVPPAAVRALLDRFALARPPLLVPTFAGRRGHPLLLARACFADAVACDDAVGLRQLLERRAADLLELPLEHEGAERDLDTPEDLLTSRLARRAPRR
jgi:molybdenum cofactor cytidylyltransferase